MIKGTRAGCENWSDGTYIIQSKNCPHPTFYKCDKTRLPNAIKIKKSDFLQMVEAKTNSI
jgi:hypothetical protein